MTTLRACSSSIVLLLCLACGDSTPSGSGELDAEAPDHATEPMESTDPDPVPEPDLHDEAWETARTAGTPEALERFLGEYPDSEHREAASDLLFDALWQLAENGDDSRAWLRLVDELPGHARAEEARRALQREFVTRAFARADEALRELAVVDAEGLLQVASTGAMPAETTPESTDAILDLLSLAVREAGPERCCGLRSIQPVEAPSPSGFAGEGDYLLHTLEGCLVGHAGRVTLKAGEEEWIELSCELPSESIFMEAADFAGMEGRVQAGHDSRYRIRGRVEGLFPGLIVEGDADEPLALGLWDDYGLVYLAGRGTLSLGETALEFPGPASLDALVSHAEERRVYEPVSGPRVLKPFQRQANPKFGRAVACTEDWILVGAPHGAGGGRVFAYRRDGDNLLEYGELQPIGERSAYFGDRLATAPDGSGAAVWNETSVEVFALRDGSWMGVAAIGAPGDEEDFGEAFALDADVLATGAPMSGVVHVYRRDGDDWPLVATLNAPDGAHEFGQAIAVAGERIAIGAKGSAHVFTATESGWTHAASIDGGATGAKEDFGCAVAFVGERLAVGVRFLGTTPKESIPDGAGAVSIYLPGEGGDYALERTFEPDAESGLIGLGAELSACGEDLVAAAMGSGYYSLFGPADLDQAVLLCPLGDPSSTPRTLLPEDGGATASLENMAACRGLVVVGHGGGEAWILPLGDGAGD